jgi:hypothetical protein
VLLEWNSQRASPALTQTSPRKELAIIYNLPFTKGDQVIVTDGQYSGQTGSVEVAIGYMTTYGLYAKVWVRLDQRSAVPFRPEQLLLVNPIYSFSPDQALYI